MNEILQKRRLSDQVYEMRIAAPDIARERKPGQFVMLQLNRDYGERIPLTIADAADGSITVIFQLVGKTTADLSRLEEGECVENILGPLGNPTRIERFGDVVCVGGGIGVAPLHPIAQAMKMAGNRVTVIEGARTRDLVILEDRMRAVADEFILVTDDGSAGRKGLVTEPLRELCERGSSKTTGRRSPDLVVAIGPPIMMKFCAETTRPFAVPTVVSLNTIMVDGTGMCGGCRVTVGGQTKFVCVDGPEFDGHEVDFDNMLKRLGSYKDQEETARHKCRLEAMR